MNAPTNTPRLRAIAILSLCHVLPAQIDSASFKRHWFAGKAEISRFQLEESRYGQQRKGHAVLIFVTEDFLREEQVKADLESGRSTKVLKLNFLKRFTTGVYDYSLMSSVFTPLDVARQPRSLKLTSSIQEWCGQVYQQLNLRGDSYRVRGHSYFRSEGDEDYELPAAMLEDEVWTRIRLAPKSLPRGTFKMIPGSFDARLRHRRLAVESAIGMLEVLKNERQRYTIRYPRLRRTLTIEFGTAIPHRIEVFEETFERGAQRMVTRGRRTQTKMLDYWNRSDNADRSLRAELGLPQGASDPSSKNQ